MSGNRLIVFVKAPRSGSVKTRLARAIGTAAAAAAYCRLVQELIGNLCELSDVELCYSPDEAKAEIEAWLNAGWQCSAQGGGDLGRRLQTAFARTFNKGVKQVVIIGSDCPAICAEDIREAWRCLAAADVVLGPARDGGYWLIGLRAEHPELFDNIPWSTSTVLRETLKRIERANLTVQFLRELRDVDSELDWREYLTPRDGNTVNI